MTCPRKVLLFSGKRKSGKDYVTDLLYNKLGPYDSVIIKISGPIKSHWANEKGLSLENLMDSTQYKEEYRKEMIEWSEKVRAKDYGYFCREAIEMYNAEDKPIWIVSDIRRKTDIKFFKETYGDAVIVIQIMSDDVTRKQRGWNFTPGIDDAESECDLDDYNGFKIIIHNYGCENMHKVVNEIVEEFIHNENIIEKKLLNNLEKEKNLNSHPLAD